jgi:hypothetical protein
MYPVSDAFKAALLTSERVVGQVTVAGVTLTVDPAGSSVTADRTAAVERTCTMVLMDPTDNLTPASASDLLHPLSGNEFTVSRGLEYADGTQETVPLGVFGINTSKIDDSTGDLVITLTGADRSYAMSCAKLANNYPIGSANLATALQTLFTARVPATMFNFAALPYLTPSGTVLIAGDDPWAQAMALAKAAGCRLFYDESGVCTLIVFPDPQTSPVTFDYAEGDRCTVTAGSRVLTRVGVFSHTVREGTGPSTSAAVRGEWMDDNPVSPTYWQGPFGDVVDYQTSSLYTSNDQATAAAQADGLASLGNAESAVIAAFPNPAHAPLDVIQVVRGRMQANAYYVMDSLTIPMSYADDMQINSRMVVR